MGAEVCANRAKDRVAVEDEGGDLALHRTGRPRCAVNTGTDAPPSGPDGEEW